MNWLDTLKTLAPTVAAALGGPLAGAAVTAIGSVFGVDAPTTQKLQTAIAEGMMTPAQVVQIKELELKYKQMEQDGKFKFAELEFKSTQGARDMQVATRSNIPGTLAVIIVTGFFTILVLMMLGILKVSDQQALLILLGALSAGFGAVLNFYFGSSHGSQSKDVLLAQSSPMK